MSNRINWESEMQTAKIRAASEKKFILLDFYNPD